MGTFSLQHMADVCKACHADVKIGNNHCAVTLEWPEEVIMRVSFAQKCAVLGLLSLSESLVVPKGAPSIRRGREVACERCGLCEELGLVSPQGSFPSFYPEFQSWSFEFSLHLSSLRSQLGAWSFYEVWSYRRSLDEMKLLLLYACLKEINNFCWYV